MRATSYDDDSEYPMPHAFRGFRLLAVADEYGPEASGGAERAAHEMYLRMGAFGASIHVMSTSPYEPFLDEGVTVSRVDGINLSRALGAHLVLSPKIVRPILRGAASGQYDAIHVNTIHYTGCVAAAVASRRTGLPLVVTAQLGSVSNLPLVPRIAAQIYEQSVGRFILRSATRVLAVSASVKHHVESIGADPKKSRVVENGVDHERFDIPPLESHDRPPVVMAVGRLLANKGPHLLVDASIRLAQQGVQFTTVFVGDGPLRKELQAKVDHAGLEDVVRFVGQVEHVEQWLSTADVVVRPSYTEGLPLAVLEAMSAGRCNVVSDIPPNCELIDGESNGLRFKTGDSADLAHVLKYALRDSELRARMGRVARLDARSRSWDRMAAETASTLLEVGNRVTP